MLLRRKLKLPITLMLFALLIYIAIKGVMYFKVKSVMDQWIVEAEGQADISYGGIDTDLRGKAQVNEIEIQPRELDKSIKIAAVSVSSDDPWRLFTGGEWQSGNEPPPKQMAVSIQGVTIELDEEVLAVFHQQAEEQARLTGQKITGNACDSSMNLDPSLLLDMGFSQITMDVDANYYFDELNEQLSAEFSMNLHEIESIDMSVEMGGILPEDMNSNAAANINFRKASMQISIDPAFGNQALKTCAEQKNLTISEYRQALSKRISKELGLSGISIGESLHAAIDTYYQDWGDLRIDVRPGKPLGMLAFVMTKPENMGDLLGINLYVNDKRVDNPEFSFVMPTFNEQVEQRDNNILPPPPLPKRVRVSRFYEKVSVDLIDQYLGANVKIQSMDQPSREGKLTSIVGGEATLVQHKHGGTVTSYVRLDQIQSLEVQKVERKVLD